MEVDDVLAVGVIGRQVGAAAEPLAVALGEQAEVGVDRRDHRVARMQDERDAAGGEGSALAGDLLAELRRHLAVHLREVDAGLLEDAAFLEDARSAAAAAAALPAILAEGLAVQPLQRGDDAVLQVAKIARRAISQ